jgi:AcrR family transcriptional regulator
VTHATSVQARDVEAAIFSAVDSCVTQWGWDKVTMDDICVTAGVSRATVYRLFPGGRDVLFEAVRLGKLEDFFTAMRAHVEGSESLEELLVRCIVIASSELQHDEHLAMMLATVPGETLGDLTVSGLGRIVRVATAFITPLTDEFIPASEAAHIVEVMCRLVISYYLSPSPTLDFANEDATRTFVRTFLLSSTSSVVVTQ